MSPFSPPMTGALIGAVLGIVSYIGLRILANRIETLNDAEDPKTTAKALRIAALADLVVFPVVGFFIGPVLAN